MQPLDAPELTLHLPDARGIPRPHKLSVKFREIAEIREEVKALATSVGKLEAQKSAKVPREKRRLDMNQLCLEDVMVMGPAAPTEALPREDGFFCNSVRFTAPDTGLRLKVTFCASLICPVQEAEVKVPSVVMGVWRDERRVCVAAHTFPSTEKQGLAVSLVCGPAWIDVPPSSECVLAVKWRAEGAGQIYPMTDGCFAHVEVMSVSGEVLRHDLYVEEK